MRHKDLLTFSINSSFLIRMPSQFGLNIDSVVARPESDPLVSTASFKNHQPAIVSFCLFKQRTHLFCGDDEGVMSPLILCFGRTTKCQSD